MQVYCPSCGHPNEARDEGAQVTCTTCTAVFEAPVRAPAFAPPPPPPAPVRDRPPAFSPPPPPPPAPMVNTGTPYARTVSPGAPMSTLAVVSFLFGLFGCVPLISPAIALITGVKALEGFKREPDQRGYPLAVMGIVLGSIWLGLQFLGFVGSLGD